MAAPIAAASSFSAPDVATASSTSTIVRSPGSAPPTRVTAARASFTPSTSEVPFFAAAAISWKARPNSGPEEPPVSLRKPSAIDVRSAARSASFPLARVSVAFAAFARFVPTSPSPAFWSISSSAARELSNVSTNVESQSDACFAPAEASSSAASSPAFSASRPARTSKPSGTRRGVGSAAVSCGAHTYSSHSSSSAVRVIEKPAMSSAVV